jgi:hypothetical protein
MVMNRIPYGTVIDMVGDEFYQIDKEVWLCRPVFDAHYYARMENWIKEKFNCWPDSDRTVFIFHSDKEALVFRLRYSS